MKLKNKKVSINLSLYPTFQCRRIRSILTRSVSDISKNKNYQNQPGFDNSKEKRGLKVKLKITGIVLQSIGMSNRNGIGSGKK
jgi:predicted secreted Zn-dependent protease